MRKPYFPRIADAPESLTVTVKRRVRFEEVDPLGIVWHGHYPSYFEDGRVVLGERYGVGYLELHEQGLVTPIKQMHVDYHVPLRFGEEVSIQAWLHWTDAARMNYEFAILNAQGQTTTTGYTVQLFLDESGELQMDPPGFYQDFLDRWKRGEL